MLDPTDSISLPLPEAVPAETNETEALQPLLIPPQDISLSESAPLRPFIVRMHRAEETSGGYFRPTASVEISPVLRTSGLLRALPADHLKSLILILTFVSPNGDVLPTVQQLAEAAQSNETIFRQNLAPLTSFTWQGERVVRVLARESGMDAITISPHLVAVEHDAPASFDTRPVLKAVGRDRLIAHSRATYARPRAEVERDIAERMGWEYPASSVEQAESTPVEQAVLKLRRRLLAVGVAKEQADFLLSRCEIADIEQQLNWLPYRHAKIPAKFIVAAIMGHYEAPPMLRGSEKMPSPAEAPTEQTVPANGEETPPDEPPPYLTPPS